MISGSTQGRRGRRCAATQAELVAAAWDLVREEGLAGLTMRDLGARVGLTAQSIYAFFASKHEIYDALFQEGYQGFIEAMDASAPDVGPVADDHERRRVLASVTRCFFDFCTSDPVRYQFLFQRTIPGFVPSAESYTLLSSPRSSARPGGGARHRRSGRPRPRDGRADPSRRSADLQRPGRRPLKGAHRPGLRHADRCRHGEAGAVGSRTARVGPGLAHETAMSLQAEELRRAVTMLGSLDPGDWAAPTDCPDWDVRRMYLHVLGACEARASRRENARQLIAAR